MGNFFLSDNGDLLRTSDCAVIRPGYQRHYGHIDSGLKLRATLRAGPYAWPGGYPLYLVMNDGDALCFDCGRKEFKCIARDMRDGLGNGWTVAGTDINWADQNCYCSQCGGHIAPAYED